MVHDLKDKTSVRHFEVPENVAKQSEGAEGQKPKNTIAEYAQCF